MLLCRRPERGLWGGMWEPPTIESESVLERDELVSRLKGDLQAIRHLEDFEHRTTHRDVVFHAYLAEAGAPASDRESRWHHLAHLDEIGLSNPHRRLIGLLDAGPLFE